MNKKCGIFFCCFLSYRTCQLVLKFEEFNTRAQATPWKQELCHVFLPDMQVRLSGSSGAYMVTSGQLLAINKEKITRVLTVKQEVWGNRVASIILGHRFIDKKVSGISLR